MNKKRTVLGVRCLFFEEPWNLQLGCFDPFNRFFFMLRSPFCAESLADLLKANCGEAYNQFLRVEHSSALLFDLVDNAADAVNWNLKLRFLRVHYYSSSQALAQLNIPSLLSLACHQSYSFCCLCLLDLSK